jgi:hypothetical protein
VPDAAPSLATFVAELAPGRVHLTVNGQVVQGITGLRIDAQPDAVPTITVRQHAFTVRLAGQGVIEVIDPDLDPVDSIVAFLDAIDPDELERQALEGHSMATSMTATMLATLKRWARGE